MPAAPPLQLDDAALVGPFGKFVFVKLADAAFERLSPCRSIIPHAVGHLPTANGECNASAVNGDDRRLVDKEYCLCVRQNGSPSSKRPRAEMWHEYSALDNCLSTNGGENLS